MKILAYLLRSKMNFRLFVVWVFTVCAGALSLGILYQLYRAAKALADNVPAIVSAI